MDVYFGWHLDGPTWPETPQGTGACLGAVVCGPSGLLSVLETRLGLKGPEAPPAIRTAQYLARLKALDTGTAFYSESLKADAWATARLLLSWRDALVLGGWNGGKIADGGSRLDTMARLEADTPALALGPAERLSIVLTSLRARGRSPLTCIHLLSPQAQLPQLWSALFAALVAGGTTLDVASEWSKPGTGDLASLKIALGDGTRWSPVSDGTVAILEAEEESTAAEALAGWLAAASNEGVTIVRSGGSSVLDIAFRKRGLPIVGTTQRSSFRGALQVLPLALELAWTPLDVRRLLELLVLPESPIPPSISRFFAGALEQAPGIGGPLWRKAWNKARTHRRKFLEKSGEYDGAALERRLTKDEAGWRQWLEAEAYDADQGMPLDAATSICRRVEAWAVRRAASTGDRIFAAAAGIAAGLARVVEASNMSSLSRTQIERMLDAVAADGVQSDHADSEAAVWHVVDGPGQIWGSAPTVVWWGFDDPGTVISPLPWRAAERTALSAAGCSLEDPKAARAREAWAWQRPIRAARDRLVIVRPRRIAGEEVRAHPLWHEIEPSLHGSHAIIDADACLRAGELVFAGRNVILKAVADASLPQPRREWAIPPATVGARDTESATSLETLLGCPFAWTLKYKAGVRAGALRSIPEGSQMVGTFIHAIVQKLFDEKKQWLPPEAAARSLELFDSMLPEIAAPLGMPGNAGERAEIRSATGRAMHALVEIVTASKLTVIGGEVEREREMPDGTKLKGTIDLLLEDKVKKPAVVDLKWAGSARYRREQLKEGRQVQLAVYGALVHETAAIPAGYFMLKQQRMLATGAPFPASTMEATDALPSVWSKAWESRRRSLDILTSGRIIATAVSDSGESEPADPEAPLKIEPPCRFCDYKQLCGQRIL